MDRDTVINHVKNLSKARFDRISDLLLQRVFSQTPININGKGDAGQDRRLYNDRNERTTASCQLTTQKRDWRNKALRDAREALEAYSITYYYYLTSRDRDPTDLAELEHDLSSALSIPCKCLGAREIADFILKHNLLPEFFETVGLQATVPRKIRADYRELALHSYIALGSDVQLLRKTVFADSILISLYQHDQALEREQLVREVLLLLGAGEQRRPLVEGQVDSLLAKGQLVRAANRGICLAAACSTELELADKLYDAELHDLRQILRECVDDRISGRLADKDANRIALLVAQAFVWHTLEAAQHAGLALPLRHAFCPRSDPIQDLRDVLAQIGVPTGAVDDVQRKLVERTNDSTLVKKLVRAAVYVSIEGSKETSGAIALGASDWAHVIGLLDTSVAVPFLCACLYQPTHGRYSLAAFQAIKALQALGVRIGIPYFYLQETAWHLFAAATGAEAYEAAAEKFSAELYHSGNGFVASYLQLRQMGANTPETLFAFLQTFSPSVVPHDADHKARVRLIQSDLQAVYSQYGIEFEKVDVVPRAMKQDLQIEYELALMAKEKSKARVLIDNDVVTLAHVRRKVTEGNAAVMCLTWDGTMIEVGREYMRHYGWIVSPEIAGDFVDFATPTSEQGLLNLSFYLARVRDKPMHVSARIIDRVVKYASERMGDWRFRERIAEFKDNYLGQIDLRKPLFDDQIDKATDGFLCREGTQQGKRQRDAGGELDTPSV